MKIIKCIVACNNSNGNADLFFVKVKGTEKQIAEGDHLQAAEYEAVKEGYESSFVIFDENDPAGKAMIDANLFVWDSASVIKIKKNS